MKSSLGPLLRALSVLCALAVASCGGDGDGPPTGPKQGSQTSAPSTDKGTSTPKPEPTVDRSAPTKKTVLTTDSVADAFTIRTPKGWTTVAFSSGEYDVHREVVTTVSPDGGTQLFLSDPNLPNYFEPAQANEVTRYFAENLDFMEIREYEPASSYFVGYAQEKFGDLPGFEIVGNEPDEELLGQLADQAAARGVTLSQADIANVRFTYTDKGREVEGLLIGSTLGGDGVWQAEVFGISTDRDADDYRQMLLDMANTRKTRPEFLAAQQQLNDTRQADIQQRTEQLRQQGEANLQLLQDNAARQQERQTSSMEAFNERMAANDENSRRFSNYILDETTIVDPGGEQRQVDDSYDRYYLNRNDGTYLGGDNLFDDDSIRNLGLDPSDYEFAPVKP